MINLVAKIRSFLSFIRIQASVYKGSKFQSKINLRLIASAFAFMLGYVGYLRLSPPSDFYGYIESWYKTLGLLVVHMPKEYPHLPIELQIARFALPVTTVWVAIGTYLDYIRKPLRHYFATNLVGHIVVCGIGVRAQAIAKQAKEDQRMVVVATNRTNDNVIHSLEAYGIIIVIGDLERLETFILASISRAAEVVISTGEDIQNIRVAIAVRTHVVDKRASDMAPLLLITECSQPDMAAILDGAFQSIRDDRLEYRLLSPEANVARGLLPKLIQVLGTPVQPGAILIIGFSSIAQAVFEHILRNAPPKSSIAIVSADASRSKDIFVRRCPAFENWPGLDFINSDVVEAPTEALCDWLMQHRAPVLVIDMGSEELNLRAALALRRFARDKALSTGTVFVRQEGSSIALEALTLIEGEPIDLSRIYQFGSIQDECRTQVVFQGELDTLAKIVHDDYRCSAEGGESVLPWKRLKETYRQASRHQADHMDTKLLMIGACKVPITEVTGDFHFEMAEIESLAELEHYRWCMDRWLEGWNLGAVKDSLARIHPMLIPYKDLPDEIKELDRRAVRNLTRLTESAGTCLQRVRRLLVDVQSFNAETKSSLFVSIKQIRSNNEMPLLEILLGLTDGISVAQWAIENAITFEIVSSLPISELRQKVEWKQLKIILEAAARVSFSFDSTVKGFNMEKASTGKGFNLTEEV